MVQGMDGWIDGSMQPRSQGLSLEKSSQNPSPAPNFKRGISLKRLRYLPATFSFRAEIGRLRTREENCQPEKGFLKICLVKK